MSGSRTICVVSGGRADYGLLVEPMRALSADPSFVVKLVLTGQHLEQGLTDLRAKVARDGFEIAAAIDMQLGRGDDAVDVTKAAGLVLAGMADVLAALGPDFVLVLGDRYEILCCALAATLARIPIVHVAGGDLTEGAFDDAFRHAITKMAHVHLVTTEEARRRVCQLGEDTAHVQVIGSPGLDLVARTPVLDRAAFFEAVGLEPRKINVVVTFHPVTLAADSIPQCREMLTALADLRDATILFTSSNADPERRRIDAEIAAFCARHAGNALLHPQLGARLYFSALAHMDVVVGNSSSGLYEAPSFGLPTVNIGDRQKGRLRAASIIDSAPERAAIAAAIRHALDRGRQPVVNPYGDGKASERLVAILRSIAEPRSLLVKRFVDLPIQ